MLSCSPCYQISTFRKTKTFSDSTKQKSLRPSKNCKESTDIWWELSGDDCKWVWQLFLFWQAESVQAVWEQSCPVDNCAELLHSCDTDSRWPLESLLVNLSDKGIGRFSRWMNRGPSRFTCLHVSLFSVYGLGEPDFGELEFSCILYMCHLQDTKEMLHSQATG